ncbi:MAG: hypothetical protein M3O35_07150 [Acidobacteriota bacterium]|nr:hypothetical protein [Acidobacteriota bacterium]
MPLHALAFLFLFQPPEASAQDKQVAVLAAQIRRLAVSEPVVFGIDTRMKAAEVLTSKYPKLAGEFLREGRAAMSGVSDPDDQDALRVRMAELLAPLDLDEAERVIRSIRRGRDEDFVAHAYDKLCTFLGPHPAQVRRMITKGLSAGAFRMESAAGLLASLKTVDPDAAVELFSEILAAFPAESAGEDDVYFLLKRAGEIAGVSRALAIEAIDKALNAAGSDIPRIKSEARRKMRREVATLLGSIDPELLIRYQSERKDLEFTRTPDPKPEEDKKPDDSVPDLSKLPYAEALSQARALENLTPRAVALIELSRREELTAQQRASLASEALAVAGKLPFSQERLYALAMLSRDFARRDEPALASLAAQMLSETFTKACDCPTAICRHSGVDFECLELVEAFAQYLDEFKITQESMSLQNISLEARMLVLKLNRLLRAEPRASASVRGPGA